MNKNLVKNAVVFLMLLALVAPSLALAQADRYFTGANQLQLPDTQTTQPVTIVTNIINMLLGLLGLLAVIIILIGGFKWMTAQGSDDKVESAKKTIKYGIIGLVIILLAYVIVRIVINAVWNVGVNQTLQ
jgi:glucose uptake protein GlcU